MEELLIKGCGGDSRIIIGESLDRLSRYLPEKNVVMVSDRRVAGLYGERFPDFPLITVGEGEGTKSLSHAETIYHRLVELGADRNTFLAAIGGGVVTDLAGFVASTYMRGIRFGFVSSTLLAQVDASVGGKNGVNLNGLKNLVGTFAQPAFVICDTGMLHTLPKDELLNGFAEIIKHGLISDFSYLQFVEQEREKLLALDPAMVVRAVSGSVHIKSAVVNRDEKEAGLRRILNFGHTAGHAIEKLTGISHGRAVAAGMVLAGRISMLLGLTGQHDQERIEKLLISYGLPVSVEANPEEIFRTMTSDKKKEGDRINFVVLEKIGRAKVTGIPFIRLKGLFDRAFKSGM